LASLVKRESERDIGHDGKIDADFLVMDSCASDEEESPDCDVSGRTREYASLAEGIGANDWRLADIGLNGHPSQHVTVLIIFCPITV